MYAFILLAFTTLAFSAEWYEKLSMPKGFKLTKYAEVRGARQMAQSPKGHMYVGTREEGELSVIQPDGKVLKLFTGLSQPQGVLWHKGDLYVAEIHRITKIKDVDNTYLKKPCSRSGER